MLNLRSHVIAAAAAVLALSGGSPATAAAEQVYRVVSVHDGDSLRILEHGPVRFAITSAPEIGSRARCPREAALAVAARDYVAARVANGVILRRQPGERDMDHHGRLLRRVFAADGGDVEAELIARGLAERFARGKPPPDWCRI